MNAEPLIHIRRRPDGSWTVHPQPPHPPTSTFLTEGWPQIQRLREQYGTVEHFLTEEYYLFIEEFGPPPATYRVLASGQQVVTEELHSDDREATAWAADLASRHGWSDWQLERDDGRGWVTVSFPDLDSPNTWDPFS